MSDLLSSASSAPREVTADDLIAELLPKVIDRALRTPDIAAGIARLDLPEQVLREAVDEQRPAALRAGAQTMFTLVRLANGSPDRSADTTVRNPLPSITTVILLFGGLLALAPAVKVWEGWSTMAVLWRVLTAIGAGVLGLVGLVCIGMAFFGVASFLAAIFGAADRYLPRRGSTSRSDLTGLKRAWSQSVLDNGVLPIMRVVLNEHLGPIRRISLELGADALPGLSGERASSVAVVTGSVSRFLETTKRLRGGSIGLAGPRGVGKTTLIEHFAGQPGPGSPQPLRVTVSAPVQYDAREFVLHLFAKLCHEVIAWGEVRASLVRRGGGVRLTVLLVLAATLSAACALPVVGLRGLVGKPIVDHVLALDPWLLPAVLLLLAALWVLGRLVRKAAPWVWRGVVAAVRWLLGWHRLARHDPRGDLVERARDQLKQIRYLQTHTTGWSGKLTIAAGEGSMTKTAQLAEQPLTYPEIIDAFGAFLAAVAGVHRGDPAVVVAIDELDKIESAEDAQKFINEIKGIFSVPQTQFIVSVSSDALAAFERRGLPVRDTFDSAFQEIVRVDNLNLADTTLLVNSWVVGLPDPFIRLAHCMSGGLPREVRRVARSIVALSVDAGRPLVLDEVCARLVGDDLERKAHAVRIAVGQLSPDDDPTDFLRHVREVQADPTWLLSTPAAAGESADLARLRDQTAVYFQHCATLLEIFTRVQDERLEAGGSAVAGQVAALDLLAAAKQSLAVHPRLARVQIEEVRTVWRLAH
ncbi:hypothetical protein [Actinokineospora sp. HUAS TT18]|uniref:hypothetical protein n=1 Tax=Actinokineospora sp. HUAS TT18 TaxID=3447451 RepID=UPI003F52417E